MTSLSEPVVEDAALAWLIALGYAVLHAPDIAAGEPTGVRSDSSYRDILQERRPHQPLARLNSDRPPDALHDAYRKLTCVLAPPPVEKNRAVHRMLVDDVTVEYRRKDSRVVEAQARVIEFDAATNNDGPAVNQFAVSEVHHTRRPDVVLRVSDDGEAREAG